MKNNHELSGPSAELPEKRPVTLEDLVSAYRRTRDLAKSLIRSKKISPDFWGTFNQHWVKMGELHLEETGRKETDDWYEGDVIPKKLLKLLK